MDKLFPHKDCPTAGTGCHAWLFYMGKMMKKHSVPDEVAVPYITERMSRPPAPALEVQHALDAARGEDTPITKKWATKSFKLVQEIMRKPLPDWKPLSITAEEAIDVLFPGNPLLCVGVDSSKFRTRPRENLRGSLANCALIVPSPMSARLGYTQEARRKQAAGAAWVPMSEHTLENTGPRHYLITEWDWGTAENHMKFIRYLAQSWPLAAVVHSGGKSTHGWWDVRDQPEDKVRDFFNSAARCGCDTRLWLKSQFCRMPGGRRITGERQEILYLRKTA